MSIISAAVFFTLFVFANCSIPDYIHVCHHDDPDLAGCIKKSIETLRPRLKSGITELEIPSIEPFSLDFLSFQTSTSDAAYLATNLTNIQIYGASNFELLKLTPKLTKNGYKFQFEVLIPQIHIEGDYEINSKLLLLQIKGNGPFNANISDFQFDCELNGKKVQKEGANYVEFEKMKCSVGLGKTSIFLSNLFNGNPLLEKATNDAINDNSEALFDEIRPNLIGALRQEFTDIANKITLYFKAEELFP